jgi:hypothetical protein
MPLSNTDRRTVSMTAFRCLAELLRSQVAELRATGGDLAVLAARAATATIPGDSSKWNCVSL